MKTDYADIRSRIAEPPTWWDQNGTPRWGEFHPLQCPDIYAKEVLLLEISCQACHQRFRVEMHDDSDLRLGDPGLADRVTEKAIHYGDPPFHDCTGDTQNVDDLRVVEFWVWKRLTEPAWTRHPELEIIIDAEALAACEATS